MRLSQRKETKEDKHYISQMVENRFFGIFQLQGQLFQRLDQFQALGPTEILFGCIELFHFGDNSICLRREMTVGGEIHVC